MVTIQTNKGNFGKFKDLYSFMQEEQLDQIEILKVEYCFEGLPVAGVYTLSEIKEIITTEGI